MHIPFYEQVGCMYVCMYVCMNVDLPLSYDSLGKSTQELIFVHTSADVIGAAGGVDLTAAVEEVQEDPVRVCTPELRGEVTVHDVSQERCV